MWILGTTRIFTQDFDEAAKNIVAKLNPFGGGSVYQKYGDEDDIYSLSAYIVGITDRDAIKAMRASDSTVVLSGDLGTIGNVIVSNVSVKRLNTIEQSFYVDANHDQHDPVFKVDLELNLVV